MSVSINGTDGVTYNDGSLQPSAPVGKNLIINGNMQIAQRATSVTGITSAGYYTCDRWRQALSGGGTYTQAQTALTSSNAPFADGFSQSVKYDCTTAYTSADSFGAHRQIIEGQNLQQLAYGTSSAKSLTLSFWVKSNVTGTAVASLYSVDSNKQISQTYTIDATNTWEYKTVTFAGDTASTFDNDNNASLYVNLVMAAGTDYTSGTLPLTWTTYANANFAAGQTIDISASTSNEIAFTGVQLEANTTATPFEHLQYQQQLALCQRYYEKIVDSLLQSTLGDTYSTSSSPVPTINLSFKQTKRALPTIATVGTFTTSNTTGSQYNKGGENNMIAYYLAAGAGRTYFYPDVNSGWSADSEL